MNELSRSCIVRQGETEGGRHCGSAHARLKALFYTFLQRSSPWIMDTASAVYVPLIKHEAAEQSSNDSYLGHDVTVTGGGLKYNIYLIKANKYNMLD